MSSLNGLTLFLTSTTISISLSLITRHYMTKSIEKQYMITLNKLFKPVLVSATPSRPSRHQNLSSEELFNIRKTFFQNLYYKQSKLNDKVKVIHIAGTKGKGSTVEYLASSLIANNYNVGVFTSPHIHTGIIVIIILYIMMLYVILESYIYLMLFVISIEELLCNEYNEFVCIDSHEIHIFQYTFINIFYSSILHYTFMLHIHIIILQYYD